jgi:O-antigen/teichoic acid export membrane protein
VAHLGVEAIGAWSLLVATMSISSVADVGVGRALLHFVPTAIAQDQRNLAASYIETAIVSVGVLFLVLLPIAYPGFTWAIRTFVAPSEQGAVLHVLPYALISFWLSNVALAFLSALAGMQRYDLRSIILMAGSATQLFVVIASIRFAGLLGLVWAQIVQNIILAAGAGLSLRQILPQVSRLPLHFSLSQFKTMRRYGASLQLYSVVSLIFEPTTKVMLSHFGGLATVGFYEMASRMANQVRTLVVNAIQVLVPALAELHQKDRARAFQSYIRMSEVIWILACPIMASVAMLLPEISEVWLKTQSHTFISFSVVVLVGWTLNLVCAPAYFMGLASGVLRWNLIGVTVTSVLNLLLAPLLGVLWGGIGVVVAFSVSLSVGSFVFFFFNHREFGGTMRQMFTLPTGQMLLVLTGTAATGNLAFDWSRNHLGLSVTTILATSVLAVAIWASLRINPAAAKLLGLFRARYSRSAR